MVYSSAVARVSKGVDFQFHNVLYSPSIRNSPLTFNNSEPIGKIEFIDFIK